MNSSASDFFAPRMEKKDPTLGWIHPSVRDTVIEYLMEHDAERIQFLRTSTVNGVMLALSTAGGDEGSRAWPLLRTDHDWNALEQVVVALASKGGPNPHRLLRGIDEALNAASEENVNVDRVHSIAEKFLDSLVAFWNTQDDALSTNTLKLYYDVTLKARILTPSPSLFSTWEKIASKADPAIASAIESEEAVGDLRHFAELIDVLQKNEPRFLRMHATVSALEKMADRILDLLTEKIGDMADLDPEEDEIVESDEGEEYSQPVDPDMSEYADKKWLNVAQYLAEEFGAVVPSRGEHFDSLSERATDLHYARERRQERFNGWQTDSDDSEAWESDRTQGSGDFDLETFFADL